MIDPVVQGTDSYHTELAKHNRGYLACKAYHFDQVLHDSSFLEEVMFDYFPEEYDDVLDLDKFHAQMMTWFRLKISSPILTKWLERCDEKAQSLTEG